MAIKDEIWDRVMQRLEQGDSFKIEELDIDDSKRKTARRTLRELEDMGWGRAGSAEKQHLATRDSLPPVFPGYGGGVRR